VKVISIGMFTQGNAAVVWRGPMLHRALQQFLADVYWGDLDVLLLDLPPGTGDVAISVGQLLPHADVIVVTTPQPAAADVAERSGVVARQTGQTLYGVIENMAGLPQPDGSVLDLFGSGGGAEVAARLSAGQDAPVPLLAQVPLSVALRTGGDVGTPVVLADPLDPASVAIRAVAVRLATRSRGLSGLSLGITPAR
jgi:ATP-binding protein involved in chromosome partitioning